MTTDELSERLLDFAARVAKVIDALPKTRMAQHVAGQLARSGTSPGPNYEEACAAESRVDFVHKLGIVLKELRESRFWLRFLVKTKILDAQSLAPLSDECGQLCNIIAKSIVTAKRNRKD